MARIEQLVALTAILYHWLCYQSYSNTNSDLCFNYGHTVIKINHKTNASGYQGAENEESTQVKTGTHYKKWTGIDFKYWCLQLMNAVSLDMPAMLKHYKKKKKRNKNWILLSRWNRNNKRTFTLIKCSKKFNKRRWQMTIMINVESVINKLNYIGGKREV